MNRNARDLYRGTNKFKKGYKPTPDLVQEEKGDILAESHSILSRLKYTQLRH
jgi:hypothetical protein